MRVAMGGIGGDIGTEPSMEEILSSIKRIIAEEGEGNPPRARRPQPVPAQPGPIGRDEILELSVPIPAPDSVPSPARAAEPVQPEPAQRTADPIVSHAVAAASRGSLEALSRLVVKPEGAASEATLEGLVREMLRPMLRDWLDARLPEIVEAMVSREIERITGSR